MKSNVINKFFKNDEANILEAMRIEIEQEFLLEH